MGGDTQDQAGYDILGLFLMAAPERSKEVDALVQNHNPAFFVATDQPRFLLEANPPLGFVRYLNRTLLQVWVLAWAMWKEMYCWSTEIWLLTQGHKAFMLAEFEALSDQTQSYSDADALYSEAMVFAQSDPLDWRMWPSQVPKPLDIASGTKEDWLIKDLVHHALAFFFLHELRHVALHQDGRSFDSPHEEELECDRWAAEFLLARSDSYAAAANEDPVLVKSKRAMGVALGTAVIAHIQELGLWESGMAHPSIAERMERLASELDLPAADLLWNVACSFLLAGLRRRGALPECIECHDQRDLFLKLLRPPTRDSGDRALA